MSELMKIGAEPTMTSLELVELINESRGANEPELQHRSFMAKASNVLGAGGVQNFLHTYKHEQNGQVYNMLVLPKREACLMAMSYSYELQAKVYDRMTELEQATKPAIPDFSNPAEAARAWANQYEQRQLAEYQRDEAIRTKAEIGSRREATAMATASAATRKASALAIQLDESAEFATVKRMQMLYGGTYSWRPLKECSEAIGQPIQKVFDANYGEVNAYHRDAWIAVYNIEP